MGNKNSSQGAISASTSWCCINKLLVQPDTSYVHLSTLDESWLCWISGTYQYLYHQIISFFWIKPFVSDFFIFKNFIFLVSSIYRFCWYINSLNSSVISNNLFWIEDLIRLSCSSYFLEIKILVSSHCEHFLNCK